MCQGSRTAMGEKKGVKTALTSKPKCNGGIMKQVLHFENLSLYLLPST